MLPRATLLRTLRFSPCIRRSFSNATNRSSLWHTKTLTKRSTTPTTIGNLFKQPTIALLTTTRSSLFHTCQSLYKEQEQEEGTVDPKHQLLIGFTCEVCKERSHHVMSKLAYTKGVVLIECPGCKNRHLIADNLGWFKDQSTTVEDLVKEKGEAIRKVVVDKDGNEHETDIMEWLPDISNEERVRKDAAKQEAEKLRQEQEKQQQKDQE
ncbi:DNL zinc finger-domain-containing protein [Circinella umbellata]|nr:DNL zinc finger-domain-containing protein [Circinella umbellata]